MAHEIDTTTGKAAIFVTGQPAWHKLGTVVSEAQTSLEAMTLAGLDWTVEQRNVAAAGPNGTWLPINGALANVRSDTNAVLGIVSTSYKPFQNAEAFVFMDELVGEKLAMFETAGSLKGGRQVWMMARLPQTYHVGKADEIAPYILLTNGHDGSKALRMIPTSVRVVCNNTLNLALNRASSSEGITIYHFGNLSDRVNQARNALGIVVKRFEEFEEQANTLAAHRMRSGQARKYFESLLPEAPTSKVGQTFRMKTLDAMLANFVNDKQSLPGVKGTAWAAYNAVSEFADHQKRVLGQGDVRLDNQLNSIWFGSANTMKQRAFEAALALAS